MKMNKKQISVIIIFGIIALVLTVVTTVLPFTKNASSLFMYFFSMLSIVAAASVTVYTLRKSKKLMSKFLGYPLYRLGIIYMTVQLLLTLIVYIIGIYYEIPLWIAIVVSVILLGFFAICCITAENAQDIVEEIDAKEIQKTKAVTYFQLDIADLVDACQNDEVRPALEKLATKFRFSDPVSTPSSEEKEHQIKAKLAELKADLNEKESTVLLAQVRNISSLLESRNRLCEKSK